MKSQDHPFSNCFHLFNPLTPMSDQDRISPYNIKQTSEENKGRYHLADYELIQYIILQTKITRTVWQTVRRIILPLIRLWELKG